MKKKFNNLKKDTSSEKMTTLSGAVNHAIGKGYTLDFKIQDNGMMWDGKDVHYDAEEVSIDNFYRFEGESDPGDNAILYLFSTVDGSKGTLIDAYGAYDDWRVSEFIREVTSIQKEKHQMKKAACRSMSNAVRFALGGILLAASILAFKKLAYAKNCN